MLQAIAKKGKVFPTEVPAPAVSKGSVLIKVVNSCISVGTEMTSVKSSGQSLIKRAMDQPDQVKKVIDFARTSGLQKTYQRVRGQLDAGKTIGYSLAGIVVATGEGVTEFKVGDHVAAAGAGLAHHAEFVDVPKNLVIKMPKDLGFQEASTVALGSIAMQGVRRADMKLGEIAVVFGTGLLGLLSIQMLVASGARVIAVDLDDNRLALAKKLGAEMAVNPSGEDALKSVSNLTGGYGADAVIFTAATNQSEPLSTAFKMCKRKGRVVLVGVVKMEINRGDIYAKELDFMISTSYGPGRYDNLYEEKGIDYPYAYVRWTEGRNMSEYLRLLSEGKIDLHPLINGVFSIDNATEAFELLKTPGEKPVLVLLDYGIPIKDWLTGLEAPQRTTLLNTKPVKGEKINVAIIGAGSFATAMHLPNLKSMSGKFNIHAVMTRSGHKAKTVAEQYGASYATTDYETILADKTIDLVLISTRHDSHADLALKALKSGKHVFVEKPLATTTEELQKIKAFYDEGANDDKPLLMVGFNRRFSPSATEIKKHTSQRVNPLVIHYRMNAGYIAPDHWVHDAGGRIVGEACHLIDLMTFFTESEITSLGFEHLRPFNEKFSPDDNVAITLRYADGSIATIHYFSTGSKKLAKEYMEIHFDEKSIIMEDYKKLTGFGLPVKNIATSISHKGQLEELEILHDVLIHGKPWPIPLWDMVQTTKATLMITNR